MTLIGPESHRPEPEGRHEHMAEMIVVQATEPYSGRVILQEFNEDHPGGVAFLVSREGSHEVAKTSAVLRQVEHGLLERVTATEDEDTDAADTDASDEDEVLTPAQKAAQTRAANKAAKG